MTLERGSRRSASCCHSWSSCGLGGDDDEPLASPRDRRYRPDTFRTRVGKAGWLCAHWGIGMMGGGVLAASLSTVWVGLGLCLLGQAGGAWSRGQWGSR